MTVLTATTVTFLVYIQVPTSQRAAHGPTESELDLERAFTRFTRAKDLSRDRVCAPADRVPASVSQLDWELLNAKVDMLAWSQECGDGMSLLLFPSPRALDFPRISLAQSEGERESDDLLPTYFYWHFYDKYKVGDDMIKSLGTQALARLAAVVPSAHVSAHCVVFDMGEDVAKTETRYVTIDIPSGVAATSMYELVLEHGKARVSITPPEPDNARREAIEGWWKSRLDAGRRLNEIRSRYVEASSIADPKQRSQRVQELREEEERLKRISNSGGP